MAFLDAVAYRQAPQTICPICGVAVRVGRRRSFPHFLFCSRCGGYFLSSPGVPPEYPAQYFSESRDPSLISRLAHPFLSFFFWLRVRQVRSLLKNVSSPRVLDYGAGDGRLVAGLRSRGVEAIGYDPSPAAAALAGERSVPVFTQVPAGPYNLVMFWHSLEHVDRPLESLVMLKPFLAPQAQLLIAVPNAASWGAEFAGERWFHYDYPFHRVHFSPQSISALLKAAGFRVEGIDFFTPEYTVAGLAQTFLNFFLPKNAFYGAVSHRRQERSPRALAALSLISLIMLLAAAPFLAVIYVLELIFRRTDAMVVIARK